MTWIHAMALVLILRTRQEPGPAPGLPTCPLIFDSWSCFNATAAGSSQREACPHFPDLGFVSGHEAVKTCAEDGSWWVHPETNK